MDNVTALVRSIFQKESLDDCSLEELQAMARQYSYFTPVQFLLVEKLRTTDENLYKEQLQKLSLHFSNPLWLDYLLNSRTKEDAFAPAAEESEIGSTGASMAPEEDGTSAPIINEDEEGIQQFTDGSFVSSAEDREGAEEPAENSTDVQTEIDKPIEASPASLSIPPLPDLNNQPTETELTFQPYHTVDYFASQGIKFVSEEKPVDRFGQQLKSFTEWLKTMKRLPQSEIPKISDIASEEKVEQMAEHSIDQGEVITETMAEVWIKQGNKEKAIETYNKLSLLNPDKSAYFASLAEQLKNS